MYFRDGTTGKLFLRMVRAKKACQFPSVLVQWFFSKVVPPVFLSQLVYACPEIITNHRSAISWFLPFCFSPLPSVPTLKLSGPWGLRVHSSLFHTAALGWWLICTHPPLPVWWSKHDLPVSQSVSWSLMSKSSCFLKFSRASWNVSRCKKLCIWVVCGENGGRKT